MSGFLEEHDITCLADGAVFSTDLNVTGMNGNELIVGGTGCGKTTSNAESRILHAKNKSLVVVLAKRKLYENYKEHLEDRGYKVNVIDLVFPERSTAGFDPLRAVKNEDEVSALAETISMFGHGKGGEGEKDPYWRMSGKKAIKILMLLAIENAKAAGRKPAMRDVFKLFDNLTWKAAGGTIRNTSLDTFFDKLEERSPGNIASAEWEGIFKSNSDVTAGCIKSTTSNMLDEIRSENITKVMDCENQLDFSTFDKTKQALFIITSPTRTIYSNYANLLYSQMFDEWINIAESKESGSLNIPVHIIADDFACGSPIKEFPGLISAFRASGISASLLIQSESQLAGIYGRDDAMTIINNCDTKVYMGGSDEATIEQIAKRVGKQFKTIASMKRGWVYVFRRGEKPYYAERYKITEDPLYIELQNKKNTSVLSI